MKMELLQTVLVYVAVGLSVGYLVWKFLWPKRAVASKKDCGHDECGCN